MGMWVNLEDGNINIIISLMRKMPFVFLPSSSGMRQPIHAIQLAEHDFLKCQSSLGNEKPLQREQKFLVGG